MKNLKYLLLLCLAALVMPLQAAGEKKEKRPAEEFLPKAGDFAISISANPLTRYIGNLFNGTMNNNYTSVGGDYYLPGDLDLTRLQPLVSVSVKYLVTDHFAIRGNVGWVYDRDKDNFYATDDAALMTNPFSQKKVLDTRIANNAGGSFSVAGEYRVGSRRVQGVFGGGLLYAFSSQSYKYSYGNAITELNQSPSTGIAGCDVLPPKDGFTYQRYLSQFQDNPTHYFGLVAFAGVEWFFAPWVSLGAEVNIAAAWHWNKATYYKAEGFNNLNGQTETWTELISPRSSGFDFGTGNIGGNLTLTFYINRNR